MWVAVFILFFDGGYRIVTAPQIFKDEKACEFSRMESVKNLTATRPDGASFTSRCIDMGQQV